MKSDALLADQPVAGRRPRGVRVVPGATSGSDGARPRARRCSACGDCDAKDGTDAQRLRQGHCDHDFVAATPSARQRPTGTTRPHQRSGHAARHRSRRCVPPPRSIFVRCGFVRCGFVRCDLVRCDSTRLRGAPAGAGRPGLNTVRASSRCRRSRFLRASRHGPGRENAICVTRIPCRRTRALTHPYRAVS